MFKDGFLVTLQGFSILRAEWHNTLHKSESKRGYVMREEWEKRKDLGEVRGFNVKEWKARLKKDEELRWDRRRVALERRRICGEGIQEGLSAWIDWRTLPPSLRKTKKRRRPKRRRWGVMERGRLDKVLINHQRSSQVKS